MSVAHTKLLFITNKLIVLYHFQKRKKKHIHFCSLFLAFNRMVIIMGCLTDMSINRTYLSIYIRTYADGNAIIAKMIKGMNEQKK